MDQRIIQLFDEYTHGGINRRSFLDRLATLAGGAAAATALLPLLENNYAHAQVVAESDPRLTTETVQVPGVQGLTGYLVRPKAGAKLPAVLVIHENRGLNPHIEDIARRLALDGFMALAPDALTPLGGYPGDEDKAREAFAKLDQGKTFADFVAAAGWLQARPDATGALGAVGFCWGGGVVHRLATQLPDLDAAVPFYGNSPAPSEAAKVKAPLLVHLAAVDERINAAWPGYEPALKAAGVKYAMHQYPGTQHGFNNDTTPRYDAGAAKLAWERTVAFFKANLAG